MLDPKFLRNEIETTAVNLKSRGYELDIEAFRALEEQRKSLHSRIAKRT
jgi:seryl-tRNA synthetase